MPKPRKYGLTATLLFQILCLQTKVEAQLLWNSTDEILIPAVSRSSTCPARSINYITDILPQQCLGTTRTAWGLDTSTKTTGDQILTLDNGVTSIPYQEKTPTITALPGKAEPLSLLNIEESTGHDLLKDSHPQGIHLDIPNAEASKQPGSSSDPDQDADNESPLDNARFLSFEEWKRQNLAKVGQSVENIGSRAGAGDTEMKRRPGSINNALDSLGEDSEIEIDFGGFVRPGTTSHAIPSNEPSSNDDTPGTKSDTKEVKHREVSGSHHRSKDAGKTCKERFNYASFDCAATVLKTNKECKGSTSVLVENKDSYMLNKCSADNKFFIVELCDDILIDTIVLANFEFFSSMFRIFRVSVSDKYPVKLEKWRELGTFEARNSREVQAFLVESPLIWARYLRVEFLAHYGSEYYCPISLLRVHGTTMMEEFNHDMKGLRGDEETELESEGDEQEERFGSDAGVVMADVLREEYHAPVDQNDESIVQSTKTALPSLRPLNDTLLEDIATKNLSDTEKPVMGLKAQEFLLSTRLREIILSLDERFLVCGIDDRKVGLPTDTSSPLIINHSMVDPDMVVQLSRSAYSTVSSQEHLTTSQSSTDITESTSIPKAPTPHSPSKNLNENYSSSKVVSQVSQAGVKTHSSSTQPPAANPTTQESFFKTIHKRLQLLETNSTLSLQYIEEQSRILRDAFSKVEKRQLAKTTAFLESLNATVLNELRDFRSQYNQLWQSTVLELSAQRELSAHEVLALSARLSLLADEIVFQKRVVILQFILIILCLGLVIFSRTPSSAALGVNYPDLSPLMQNGIKSSGNLTRYAHFETPNTSPSSTRPSSRYGLLGRGFEFVRSSSDESRAGSRDGNQTKSPVIEYSPPTPTSQDCDTVERKDDDTDDGQRLGKTRESTPLDMVPEPSLVPQSEDRREVTSYK